MATRQTFEKTMNKRLSEINDQLDFVYGAMQESLRAQTDEPDNKAQAMKDYDTYLGEYKDLLSCQIMIAKNYNDIVGVGNKTAKSARTKKTTLERLRIKEGTA